MMHCYLSCKQVEQTKLEVFTITSLFSKKTRLRKQDEYTTRD